VHNPGSILGSVSVVDNAYGLGGPWNLVVEGNSVGTFSWDIAPSGFWYDFTVSSNAFERRFAGRMETGVHGISDPAMPSL
jgi:phospholipase C